MGQYHYTVNLSKHEFIHPHQLGDGLKLLEQVSWSPGGINDALHMLLACSSGRGGGDFQTDDPDRQVIGRWAGDRIAVVGDYAVDGDLPAEFHAETIYSRCVESGEPPPPADAVNKKLGLFRDITLLIRDVMEREYELVYWGVGWLQRNSLNIIKDYRGSHGRGDRHAVIGAAEYPMSQLLPALKKYLNALPVGGSVDFTKAPINVEDLGITPISKAVTPAPAVAVAAAQPALPALPAPLKKAAKPKKSTKPRRPAKKAKRRQAAGT